MADIPLDPLMGVGIVVVFVAVLLYFVVLAEQRQKYERARRLVKFALWCSPHQTVHAGKIPNYFDADLFLGDPKNIDMVLRWFLDELEDLQHVRGRQIDKLVFTEKEEGPVGALTLKDLFSWRTGIPSAIVRPRRRGPALRVKLLHTGLEEPSSENYVAHQLPFEGGSGKDRVVLISDVSTTGKTIIKAVKHIRMCGGEVEAVFVLYDREEKTEDGRSGDKLTAAERLAKEPYSVRLSAMMRANEEINTINSNKRLREDAKKKGVITDTSLNSC